MNSTRAQVEHEHILVTAASFTFGREALLPSIFMELIKQPMLKVSFDLISIIITWKKRNAP